MNKNFSARFLAPLSALVPTVAAIAAVATAIAIAWCAVFVGTAPASASTASASTASASTAIRSTDDLTQIVDGAERVVRGEAVTIDAGHIDMGPKLVDGKWELLIRDDTAQPAVWRQPKDVVIRVVDQAIMPAPAGEKYAFLPTQAGQKVYVVPQVQAANVVWIGWNTQDPAIASSLDRGANLRLLGVRGAGELALFLQDGAFGDPLPMWDSRKQEPQDVWMEANTHVHANWVFTQAGAYTAAIQVVGKDKDQKEHTAAATLHFAVGDAVTDEAARQAPEPDVAASAAADSAAADTASSGRNGESSGGESNAGGSNAGGSNAGLFSSPIAWGVAIAAGVGVLVLIGVLIVAYRKNVRLRREALAAAAEEEIR